MLAAAGALVLSTHDGGHGTLQGSGIRATETRSVAAFAGVDLAGSTAVTVTVGGPQRVVVRADTNLLSHVTTRVEEGRLVIGNTPGSIATVTPMSVAVTVPSLTALTISGSGSISAAGGATRSLTVVVSGSGDLRAGGVTARAVRASISGFGRIVVTVTDRLDASIRGSGTVMYAGHPTHVRSSVTGSGSVVPF